MKEKLIRYKLFKIVHGKKKLEPNNISLFIKHIYFDQASKLLFNLSK